MNFKTKDLIYGSFFLALGLIIPYFFHLLGIGGQIFLPMHLPVLLCGFILGSRYGLIVGFITPLLSSILTGMPPIYPVGFAMAFELSAYGFISGYLYNKMRWNVIPSLASAMLIGRVMSGIANYLLITFGGKQFILKMFLTAAFIRSIWGIVIQLILIPIIIKSLEKSIGRIGVNEQ
ncbi:ECF transporter S component [Wukongibacter sp. M2B1]|uniref:ECF transporter S component n=1 Tax=Wukongibacter sp. M2B1 TaxID=3088895 RepID=UPI003D7A41E7